MGARINPAISMRSTNPHVTNCPRQTPPKSLSRRVVRSAQVENVETPVKSEPPQKRTAKLAASKLGLRDVRDRERPLADYMALPASQYSVLDARKIERVSDTTFRCYVGQLKMLSWSLEPVVTVSVETLPGGCDIKLLSCDLRGSQFVEDLNNRFSAQMANRVRWQDIEQEGMKQIKSETSLEVVLEVPKWCSFLPNDRIEGVGSGVLQNVLNIMVPRFLEQLEKDYAMWASGDESRKPVGEM